MVETRNKVFLCFDVIDRVIPLRIYYQNIEQTTEEQIPSIVLDQERRLCSQARTQQVPFFCFLSTKQIYPLSSEEYACNKMRTSSRPTFISDATRPITL